MVPCQIQQPARVVDLHPIVGFKEVVEVRQLVGGHHLVQHRVWAKDNVPHPIMAIAPSKQYFMPPKLNHSAPC